MMDRTVGKPENAGIGKGVAVKVVGAWIVLPLFFLVAGGSLAWWEAWAYCVVLLAPMTVFAVYIARTDPEFIARRSALREKERAQQRVLLWGYPAMIALLVVPGLDHRFGWSAPPRGVVIAALAIVFAGYLAILRVFLENRWAGRTVEVCAEQKVITTGPYAVVRHPMYAGSIAFYVATPVALGSWWALIPALSFIPIFALRIQNEEELLVRELPGYADYRHKVRYRLLPFVW